MTDCLQGSVVIFLLLFGSAASVTLGKHNYPPSHLPELFCCLSSNWKDMFAVPKMERYITRVVEQRYFTPFPNSPATDSKQTHAQKCARVHSAVTT